MAQPSRTLRVQPQAPAQRTARALELGRRIEELEREEESSFGRFTAWDWLACVVGSLVVPVAALWWFAG
jgi:hypothetical protein